LWAPRAAEGGRPRNTPAASARWATLLPESERERERERESERAIAAPGPDAFRLELEFMIIKRSQAATVL
jgi:hypothetical protein